MSLFKKNKDEGCSTERNCEDANDHKRDTFLAATEQSQRQSHDTAK